MTEYLTTPSGARLRFAADRVIKVHRPGTDPGALRGRLAVWPGDVGLTPLETDLRRTPPETTWPRVMPVSSEAWVWGEAGALLGRLHRPVTDAPHHGWPERLARAVERVQADWLLDLGNQLASLVANRDEPAWLIHGDFHLGQLGWLNNRLYLLDPDDSGAGDPAWDLARIAGFWAAGLLTDQAWHDFLDGYRSTADTGLARCADPWSQLDLPARVAVFVAAARSQDHSKSTTLSLLKACRQMANLTI